MAEALGGS